MFRDKVGKSPGELGVSKSRQCDIYPLKCFDTVGWMTIRASGHKCWNLGVNLSVVVYCSNIIFRLKKFWCPKLVCMDPHSFTN